MPLWVGMVLKKLLMSFSFTQLSLNFLKLSILRNWGKILSWRMGSCKRRCKGFLATKMTIFKWMKRVKLRKGKSLRWNWGKILSWRMGSCKRSCKGFLAAKITIFKWMKRSKLRKGKSLRWFERAIYKWY